MNGQGEHDAAWAMAVRATETINQVAKVRGHTAFIGPVVQRLSEREWRAWIIRESSVVDAEGPSEAQALRALGYRLLESPATGW